VRGTAYRYCSCRDRATGRELADCPKRSSRRHGGWAYTAYVLTLTGRRRLRRRGFGSKTAAEDFGDQVTDLLDLAEGDRQVAARIGDLIYTQSQYTATLPTVEELRRRLGAGADLATGEQTVGEYLAAWLAGKRRMRPATRRAATAHVAFFTKHLGDIPLHRLTRDHVNTAIATRIADSERATRDDTARRSRATANGYPAPPGRPLTVISAASLARMIATLRSALSAAVLDRRLTHNPAARIELPEHIRPEIQPWSPEEAGTFLDAIADDSYAPLYELILLEGLRRGEAAGLRWDDLTIDNPDQGTGILRIRRQRVDVAGRIHETPPKTRSGERRIELGRRSVHLLLAHHTAQTKQRLAAGPAWIDTGYIFTDPTGRPLRPETITRRFRRLVLAAGVRPVRVHDLRHLSASLQIQAGVSITLISKRLGHSTTRITGDIYGHILPGAGHAASNAAEALIPRKPRQRPPAA
jgi:integrase